MGRLRTRHLHISEVKWSKQVNFVERKGFCKMYSTLNAIVTLGEIKLVKHQFLLVFFLTTVVIYDDFMVPQGLCSS